MTTFASSSSGTTTIKTVSLTPVVDEVDELVKRFGGIPVRTGRTSDFETTVRTDKQWRFICWLMRDLGMDARASYPNEGAELTKATASRLIDGLQELKAQRK